jgi:hypothetical protein
MMEPQESSPYFLLGKARVNHKYDSINGERCFSDVGRDNNFASDRSVWSFRRRRLEYPLLQVGRESGVQRNALEFSNFWTKVVNFSCNTFARFLDFL